MINAFLKAFAQLSDPAMRRLVWIGFAGAALVFIALWTAVGYLLTNTALFETLLIEWAVDLLGGIATLVLTWVLFPGIVGIVIGVLLESVVRTVEARHFPHLNAPSGTSVMTNLIITGRFLAIMVVLNLVMLVFLIIPPVFPFVFFGVNGYLLGREYFELVAQRRASRQQTVALRRARRGQIMLVGVVIALLMTVPVVNLVTPIVATATMVHLFQDWNGPTHGQEEG